MGARRDSRDKSAHTASLPLCENLEQYVGVDHMGKSWRHCRYFFGNPNGRRIGIGVSLTETRSPCVSQAQAASKFIRLGT